jgi:UDP-GlcNAc:undecaprenyl-phosphate/decaprenyl-phosphate GlcNAc-1-phosphate transferase
VALIIACALAVVLTPVAARVANRLGVVDQPGPLKVHEQPVPYLGGVAVFVASGAVVAFERPSLLIPLAAALVLGIADDVHDLPVSVRLVGEIVVGACAAAVVPTRGPIGIVATLAFVVVLLNAVNLLDGLDGLASGVVAASALGFAIALDASWSRIALGLAGALLGFLVWNRPPARIYLGDAGSYLLGTALALLLARAWAPGEPIALGAGSLLFVAVPVADTTVAIVRRARARRPLLQGDRGHVYDQLVDRGLPGPRVMLLCIAAQAVMVAIGLGITALDAWPAVVAASAVIVVAAAGAMRVFTSPGSWSR